LLYSNLNLWSVYMFPCCRCTAIQTCDKSTSYLNRSEWFRHFVPLNPPAACISNREIADLPRSRDTCLVTVIIIISPIQGNDVPKTRRGLFARWGARKRQRLTSGHPGWCGLEMGSAYCKEATAERSLFSESNARTRAGPELSEAKGETGR
jgi:hypothetical protein